MKEIELQSSGPAVEVREGGMSLAGDVLRIDVPLHWTRVQVSEKHFDWHKDLPKTVRNRDLISGPKIYRWVLRESGIESVYIGQSERFEKRLSAYRSGNRKALASEYHVRAKLKQCEDAKGIVELEFLDLDKGSFYINGKLVANSSLGDHEVRLMMESVAIVAARASSLHLLNRLQKNVGVKDIERIVGQYPGLLKTSSVEALVERISCRTDCKA